MSADAQHYGIIEIQPSGFINTEKELVIGKQCSICSCWYPLSHEHFYRNGTLKKGHRWDSYCTACRKDKTKWEMDAKLNGKDNSGTAEKMREAFKFGELSRKQPSRFKLVYVYGWNDPEKAKQFEDLILAIDIRKDLTTKEWVDKYLKATTTPPSPQQPS